MALNYLPATDAGLLAWSGTFDSRISTGFASYGLSSAQATSYATARANYASKLAASLAPETRGGSTCYAKDVAKAALVTLTRKYVKQIQGVPTVTNQQRYDLGINVPAVRQRIPAPSATPAVAVKSVDGNAVTITLRDPADAKRRKPVGVQGMYIFSHTGDAPPADPSLWRAEGGTTATKVMVEFPLSAEPFSKVWITAQYYNPRGETGVCCTPISTNLGTWLVQSVAAQGESPMKVAA